MNRTAQVPIEPARGLILDKNNFVLARDNPGFALEIIPNEQENLDATIEKIKQIIPVSEADIKRFNKMRLEGDKFDSFPIRSKLTEEEVAKFSVQQFNFKGVSVAKRSFREYPEGDLGVHVVGYVGRVNQRDKERIKKNGQEDIYQGTTHIGKLGIEQSYESLLHGTNGYENLEVMASGRQLGVLDEKPAIPGFNLQLTIDAYIQSQVEKALNGRRGALVAIEPSTGQVLAFVSAPTYDANQFVDGISETAWKELNESKNRPLFNRALQGAYPPGSTYKPFMGLAALETGKRTPGAITNDPGYWMFGNHRFRSHGNGGLGAVNMHRSIVKSSNVYYYQLANDMGVNAIHDFMKPLGFGQITGIDIPGEARGVLPSTDWKRRTYRRPEQQKWYAGETISLGIGQGYNNFTMLQLASATATLAADGVRHTPHLVKAEQDPQTLEFKNIPQPAPVNLGYQPAHVALVKRGMVGVTQEGTSTRVFAGAAYLSGGKTGTAQAVTIGQKSRYDARRLAEHQRDHSLYIAFAPADNPRIAVAAIVENAGFGAAHAAPLVRRVMDYWLAGQYPSEADLRAVQQGQAGAPIGTPRRVADMVFETAPALP